MTGDRSPVTLPDAVRIVLSGASQLEAEFVDLSKSRGRITAVPVNSRSDLPAFDNSAMDGFAVRHEDVSGAKPDRPIELRLTGESRAGRPWQGILGPGEAVGISTGAMVPEGADSVLRIEDVRIKTDTIGVDSGVGAGRDIRRRGEIAKVGEELLPTGSKIGASEVGALAAAGEDPVACVRRPRVRLLTCGDELVAPDTVPGPGQIRNSNQAMISAMVEEAGGEIAGTETVPDQLEAMVGGLSRALDADLTVVCGGISVGEHDHAEAAFKQLNIAGGFAGVSIRPGRPARYGCLGSSRVMGLPGNPFSALVVFRLLASPLLAVLGGRGAPATRKAGLAVSLDRLSGSFRAVPCRFTDNEPGADLVPIPMAGSHDFSSLLSAECLALIPPGKGQVADGDEVDVVAFGC